MTGFYSGAKMRTTVIVALAGSAAAFSPMMSMETGRRRIVQSGAAAVAAAPLLRSTPAAAKYDKVSCNAPSALCRELSQNTLPPLVPLFIPPVS